MDSYINPTLLLGIIGGILLFGATTVMNGTIWATAIETTARIHGTDSVRNAIPPMSSHDEPGEPDVLFRSGDTARWAMNRRSNVALSVPVDCVRPALVPLDDLLDIVCELDR